MLDAAIARVTAMLEVDGGRAFRPEAPHAGAASPQRHGPSPAVPPIEGNAVERLRQHPGFAEAMAQAARNTVELYQGSRLTNLIANDRGRFLLSVAPLYLHHTRRADDPSSGFTASRLKQFALEQEICSAGRAAAMLTLMRWAGMIAPAPASADRRVRLLEPTSKLIDMHRERYRRQFEAASALLPELHAAVKRCEDDGFVYRFAVAQTRQFVGGIRIVHLVPELSLFFERSAGLLVLASLLVPDPAAASAAGLARRFHVSRTHVVTMLRDAVAANLLLRDDAAGLPQVGPVLREASERFFAAVFLFNLAAAMSAMAEPDTAPVPAGSHAGLNG